MFALKRRALTWGDVRVGLFIFVGLCVVVISIFLLQPGKHLGGNVTVRSIFASVGGLTQGAPVMMSGVQVGAVTQIRVIQHSAEVEQIPSNQALLRDLRDIKKDLDAINISTIKGHERYQRLQRRYARRQSEIKRVSVIMEVDSAQRDLIGANSIATIKNQGLVGDKYVDMTASGPDSPRLSPVRDAAGVSAIEITGQEPIDINAILQNASGAASSFEDLLSEVDSSITEGRGTLGKLIKDPSVHDNLKATLKETSRATRYSGDLMQTVKEGKGTVGKLFNDPALYNSTNQVMKDMEQGKGTLGRLMNDPSIYDNTNGAVKQMNTLVASVNRGDGTFQRLLHDSSLYQNTNHLMEGTSALVDSANHGKGSLGKFATDEAFYANANRAMEGLAKMTDKINKGEGSIGLLMQDKRIYQNFSAFSDEMLAFIREFRKNPKKYLTVQLNVIKLF